jgi:two-component system, NarL family, response regulator DevR
MRCALHVPAQRMPGECGEFDRLPDGPGMTTAAVPAGSTPLRLLIVDDHEVVRQGLAALIGRREHVRIVAQAGSAAAAIRAVQDVRPDVVLMDVRLPDGSGIEATREIRDRWPETKVVMLTGYADTEALFASILAGASGYLLKQIRGPDLVRALQSVGRGESLLDPSVTQTVFQRVRRATCGDSTDPVHDLTRQEQEILLQIAGGKTNREIAREISMPETTVKSHVSTILAKLHVQRRAQAAAFVAQHRLPDAE